MWVFAGRGCLADSDGMATDAEIQQAANAALADNLAAGGIRSIKQNGREVEHVPLRDLQDIGARAEQRAARAARGSMFVVGVYGRPE
jgi:hypothetical protein